MVYFYVTCLVLLVIDFVLTAININKPNKWKDLAYIFGMACLAYSEVLTLLYLK